MTEPGPDLAPGARIFLEQEELFEMRRGGLFEELAVASVRSPIKPTANEDGALVLPIDARRAVLAVADGVGGQPAATQASRIALERLRRAVQEAVNAGLTVREGVLRGIEAANDAVMDEGEGSATTLAVVEVEERSVRSYHVGDSGVLAFDAAGGLSLRTIAHSPVGYAIEAGVLDEREAMEHGERHLVSNVIGDFGLYVGVGGTVVLAPGDTLVLATDGLFDNLHAGEIVQRLRIRPLEQAVRELLAECRERMLVPKEGRPSKPDDLTLIAFRLARP